MIEKIILDHLKKQLQVPVYLEYPHTKQEGDFVVFEKTGSNKKEHLSKGMFAFQSYSDRLFGAAELNLKVKKTVEGLIILDQIAKVRLNSDYNFTDTQTKKYRYQAVFDINYYEN